MLLVVIVMKFCAAQIQFMKFLFLIFFYRREVNVRKLCNILFCPSVFQFLIKLVPAVCFTEFPRTQYFTSCFLVVLSEASNQRRTLLALYLHSAQRLNNVLESRTAYLNSIFTWLVCRQVCPRLFEARRV
jgi:hypothetical protein